MNGGNYEYLKELVEKAKNYEVIFWMANVPNELEKVRDVLDVIEVVYRFSREVEHSEKNLKKMEHMMPIYHAKFC